MLCIGLGAFSDRLQSETVIFWLKLAASIQFIGLGLCIVSGIESVWGSKELSSLFVQIL